MPSEDMTKEVRNAMAKDVRAILKGAYDRGVAAGRKIGFREGIEQSERQALLETQAHALDSAAAKVPDEPAQTGFREAAAILRDLAEAGPVEKIESTSG